MSEEKRNSADDIESGLDSGANTISDAASMARGQLPSRPGKPASRGADSNSAGVPQSPGGAGASGTPGKPGGPGGTGGPGGPGAPGGTGGQQGHNPNSSGRTGNGPSRDGNQPPGRDPQTSGKDTDPSALDKPALDVPQAPSSTSTPNSIPSGNHAPSHDASSRHAAQPQNSASEGGQGLGQAPKSGGGIKGNEGGSSSSGSSAQGGSPAGVPGEAGAEAGSAMGEGAGAGSAAGETAAAGAGSGGATGAGTGAAASASGSAAAGTGAAAGGTAAGAATGAAAGTVAGPVGTVVGAAAGLLLPKIIKGIFKIAFVVIFFIAIFMMQPSLLYDNPVATSDRNTLEDTYNWYYDSIENEYYKDIIKAQQTAWKKCVGYESQLSEDPTALLEGTVRLPDEEAAEVQKALNDTTLYDIEWRCEVYFLREVSEYLEAISNNINYVISFMDLRKKNWFEQLWDYYWNTVTNGWYSNFIDAVDTWWTGIWQEFVVDVLVSVAASVEYEVIMVERGSEGDVSFETIAIITVQYTFDIRDKGVGFYADKMDLDEEGIDRGTEMAFYMGDLFGTLSEEYVGWFVTPGFHDEEYSGGSTASSIIKALEELDADLSDLHYDPNGRQVFPLQGYSQPESSCLYGPRPYFPQDPFHSGIDFAAPRGTPIVAVADGVVLYRVRSGTSFGNRVVVYHGDNVATMYAHMDSFGSFQRGDRVRAGDVIGYVGRTGLSTGNHLHFQVHTGASFQVRNPVGFFGFLDYLKP